MEEQEFEAKLVSGEQDELDELKAWLGDGIRAKIRYAAKPAEASVTLLDDGRIMASFSEPQRAPTPGQSIVFYKGDLVIGGGFID